MFNLIYTILCILCLCIGFYFGFRIGKEKEIPKVKIKAPSQIIKEHKANKEEEKEMNRLNTILNNIDNYNGTSDYQQEVE